MNSEFDYKAAGFKYSSMKKYVCATIIFIKA